MNLLPREEWISALKAVPEHELERVVNAFPADWSVRPKALPQSGLGMLKMRDSALGDAYYLGEFPMATCWVEVSTQTGESAEGAAVVMDDRVEQAERMALCDAVLSGRLPGWESVAELVAEGGSLREQTSRERKSILARTRVDFSLLDDVGDNDA